MEAGSEPSGRALGSGAVLFSLVVGGLLLGAVFAGDGSDVGGILPVGGAAVAVLAVSLVLVALGRAPAPRVGRWGAMLVAALVGLTVWIGVTMSWSIVADRSWDAFNKAIAYCAFLGVGIVFVAVGREMGARLVGWILSAVLGVTLAWALVAKAVPALDPEGDRVARLREPIGYWNALALLADVAIVLGLWLASESGHRRVVRVLGAVLVYGATLALMLTLSRTGVVVGVAVIALWLLVGAERLQSTLVLAASAGPAVLVGAWAFMRPALTEDVAARSDRVSDGAVLGVLTLVGAAVVVVLVTVGLARSLEPTTRRRLGRVLIAVAAAGVLAVGVAASVSAADAVTSSRDCREVVNDPSRLGSLDANLRLCWWEEALDVFDHHGVEGAGAGSFEIARKRFREDARNVVQPHSVPLQHLADGGVAGIALFVLVILAGAAVCVCTLRRLAGAERAAAAALVAAPAAYAIHALVDYNWDFLAVTAPTALALGALAGAGRAAGAARTRPLLAVGALLVAALALASFSFPRLADRELRASTRELVAGDTEQARDHALWAQVVFNRLSAEPYLALARVAERQGRVLRAEREYINAIELQPENPETWYTAGIFEFEVRDNMCAAYRYLNEAFTRDPVGNQWVDGGPLDVARDAVNAGGCALGS
ncbi:MAG TPA: O-antigen ligase family protein [Gaiellaceae bacterium]|nr:O-antigen ligase family protein [Gaiellaceae bacterium]